MITYICGTNGIRYREFPKAFWEDVNSLMAEGDEILLGDSDFDHRVYGRCRNKQYENVSMMRYFPPRHSFPLSQIKADIPSRVKMMKKCDRMIAVWDGESEDVFLNLLLLAALNKKCKLYHLPSGSCIGIGTIEDLKPFVNECHGWTDEDIRDVFVKCGFSEEMVEYNTGDGKYGERYLAEIICKAPVSLKAKFAMLQDLRQKNSKKYDAFISVSELISEGAPFDRIGQTISDVIGDYGVCLDDCCAAIRHAEFDLENNDLFYEKCVYCLYDEWYDTDVFWVKSYPLGVFASMKDVKRHMKLVYEYENDAYADDGDDEGYECATWFKVEAWWLGEGGTWPNTRYDFYFYKGEVCWFEELHLDTEKNGLKQYSSCGCEQRFLGGLMDLNMPTPYKPGDIVNIDCMPFGPPFHAVITEADGQFDGCFPQILFKVPFTDKWQLQALKHKRLYKDAETHSYEPALSPLYRIRRVRDDELTEDDELLVRFSKELSGSEEKARAFWEAWHKLSSEEKSEEEVVGLMERLMRPK